eukprot:UC4_evm3s846
MAVESASPILILCKSHDIARATFVVEKLCRKLGNSLKKLNSIIWKGEENAMDEIYLSQEKNEWIIFEDVDESFNFGPLRECLYKLGHKFSASSQGNKIDDASCDTNDGNNFRVFLSCREGATLPDWLRAQCHTLALSEPFGLQAHFQVALESIDEYFEASKSINHPQVCRQVFLGLCITHAVVSGRQDLGIFAWRHPYSFGMFLLRDIGSSVWNMFKTINNSSEPPAGDFIESIQCSVLNIYSSQMCDEFDVQLVSRYIKTYLKQDLLSTEPVEIISGLSTCLSYDDSEWWNAISCFIFNPNFDSTVIYKVHPQVMYMAQTPSPITQVDEVQMGMLNHFETAIVERREDSVSAFDAVKVFIDVIVDHLPSLLNVSNAKTQSPLDRALFDECIVLNRVLSRVGEDLKRLDTTMRLSQRMSVVDEEISRCIRQGTIPICWTLPDSRKTAQNDLLSIWIRRVVKHRCQLNKWLNGEDLRYGLWLGGFANPLSVIACVLGLNALQDVNYSDFIFSAKVCEEKINHSLDLMEGQFVLEGALLQGARWNKKEKCIDNFRRLPPESYFDPKVCTGMPLPNLILTFASKDRHTGKIIDIRKSSSNFSEYVVNSKTEFVKQEENGESESITDASPELKRDLCEKLKKGTEKGKALKIADNMAAEEHLIVDSDKEEYFKSIDDNVFPVVIQNKVEEMKAHADQLREEIEIWAKNIIKKTGEPPTEEDMAAIEHKYKMLEEAEDAFDTACARQECEIRLTTRNHKSNAKNKQDFEKSHDSDVCNAQSTFKMPIAGCKTEKNKSLVSDSTQIGVYGNGKRGIPIFNVLIPSRVTQDFVLESGVAIILDDLSPGSQFIDFTTI